MQRVKVQINRKTSAQLKNQVCISQNWRTRKHSTVASGSSHIKIHYFDNPKRFINTIK